MTALDFVQVDGYKSIRSAKIDLGAVNVLVGANGAGKSNLLGVFGLLADLAEGRLQLHIGRQGGADAILHFGRKKTSALLIALQFGLHGYAAALVPSAGDTLVFEDEMGLSWERPSRASSGTARQQRFGVAGHKESGLVDRYDVHDTRRAVAEPVVAAMTSWRPFHVRDTGRSAPVKQKCKIDDHRALRAEGDNLAPVLYALQATAPGAYRRIVEAVRSVAPFFDDFSLVPDAVDPEVIQLAWRHRGDGALFTAESLSDATLRFICLATLLCQPELPSLIVIDEPELGLAPFAIAELAALVRAAASTSQVLLATQSVALLDQFNAGEVIVAERNKGESTFRRLDDKALEGWKQESSLGPAASPRG